MRKESVQKVMLKIQKKGYDGVSSLRKGEEGIQVSLAKLPLASNNGENVMKRVMA